MAGKGGAFPGDRPCAHPGCTAAGEYRAPLEKPRLAAGIEARAPHWQYLCLDHVREFNARWNFFDGMSEEEMYRAQSPYPAYERAAAAFATSSFHIGESLGVLRWKAAREPDRRRPLSADDRRALARLGLPDDATLAEVKAKYRQLARRYHPDANGGDRRHEARLQALNDAYSHLKESSHFEKG